MPLELSIPYTNAVVVLGELPLLIVLPAANDPEADSTGTVLRANTMTKISVNAGV